MSDREEGRACPVLLMHHMEEFFTGYGFAEKGVLPYSGGWREQPHIWVRALKVIGIEVAIVSKERIEQSRAERQ